MEIKYFVRTTNDRQFNYDIEYEKLVDKNYNPVGSFISQLKIISDFDAVLLEDDLVLCKDFKNRIEEVIKKYPNNIINFYTKPNEYFTTHESERFSYNQCTYYPRGLALKIALKMEELRKMLLNVQYDVLEDNALKFLGIIHIQYRPCLVQHLDNDSFINKANGRRRTIYFIDYLDELNIDYENSYNKENRNKIIKLMNEIPLFEK